MIQKINGSDVAMLVVMSVLAVLAFLALCLVFVIIYAGTHAWPFYFILPPAVALFFLATAIFIESIKDVRRTFKTK